MELKVAYIHIQVSLICASFIELFGSGTAHRVEMRREFCSRENLCQFPKTSVPSNYMPYFQTNVHCHEAWNRSDTSETFISSRARPPAWGKIRTVRPVASVEIPDMLAFQREFKV